MRLPLAVAALMGLAVAAGADEEPSVFLIARDGTVARIERGYGKDAASLLLGDLQRALGPAARTARAARASE